MAFEIISNLTNSVALSSFAFLILVLIMVYRTVRVMKIPKNKGMRFFIIMSFLLLLWFGAVFLLGNIGFFAKNPLFAPNIIFGFLVLFHFLRMAYHSKTVQTVAEAIPTTWIVAIQTYRIVGVGFLILYAQKQLPAAFALPSGIGDILVGVSAPFVAILYYLKKPYSKKLAIVWNIIGIADLVIAVSVGILGFPRPVQFLPLAPSTEPLSLFPLVIIPLFAVPLATLLHFLSLRVLQNQKGLKITSSY